MKKTCKDLLGEVFSSSKQHEVTSNGLSLVNQGTPCFSSMEIQVFSCTFFIPIPGEWRFSACTLDDQQVAAMVCSLTGSLLHVATSYKPYRSNLMGIRDSPSKFASTQWFCFHIWDKSIDPTADHQPSDGKWAKPSILLS